eukprot:gene3669-4015_t
MKAALVRSLTAFLVISSWVAGFHPAISYKASLAHQQLQASSFADLFSNDKYQSNKEPLQSSSANAATVQVPQDELMPGFAAPRADSFLDKASRLRQEAEMMEIALYEEAKAKGIPEELIQQFISKPKASIKSPVQPVIVVDDVPAVAQAAVPFNPAIEIGLVAVGDPLRCAERLNELKAVGRLRLWDSFPIPVDTPLKATATLLQVKTGIEPARLRLDAVGFPYQTVFYAALSSGTVLGLSSMQVGGELGFILGYLSAAFPLSLVALGSVAPEKLGDIVNAARVILDEKEKRIAATAQAGKLVAGYLLGLPLKSVSKAASGSSVMFYNSQSGDLGDQGARLMFSRPPLSQSAIARASVVYLAGAVAQCLSHGQASGSNAQDVRSLLDLVASVEPGLTPEEVQDHIRWSALTAYDLLANNRDALDRCLDSVQQGHSIEQCISAIEGGQSV